MLIMFNHRVAGVLLAMMCMTLNGQCRQLLDEFRWNTGTPPGVMWANDCNWGEGVHLLHSVQCDVTECGGKCFDQHGCTHFSYQTESRTCNFFAGRDFKAPKANQPGEMCGFIDGRPYGIITVSDDLVEIDGREGPNGCDIELLMTWWGCALENSCNPDDQDNHNAMSCHSVTVNFQQKLQTKSWVREDAQKALVKLYRDKSKWDQTTVCVGEVLTGGICHDKTAFMVPTWVRVDVWTLGQESSSQGGYIMFSWNKEKSNMCSNPLFQFFSSVAGTAVGAAGEAVGGPVGGAVGEAAATSFFSAICD